MNPLDGCWVYDPETERFSRATSLSERELYAAWRSGARLVSEAELCELIDERAQAQLGRIREEAARWN